MTSRDTGGKPVTDPVLLEERTSFRLRHSGRELLLESLALAPRAATAFNLAVVARAMGATLEAEQRLVDLLAGRHGELADDRRRAADTLLREVRAEVAVRKQALIGARVLVPSTALPPLAENEFYYHEIEGFEVVTTDGRALGQVSETFSTGTNDVWTVRSGEREYLIPAIADVVRTIDREQRRITIEPMPGLLD